MAAHPVVYIEFSAQDPAASAKFYSDVFGWKIDMDPKFDYYMFAAEGGPGGGFVKPDSQMYSKGDVITYIDTDDVDATGGSYRLRVESGRGEGHINGTNQVTGLTISYGAFHVGDTIEATGIPTGTTVTAAGISGFLVASTLEGLARACAAQGDAAGRADYLRRATEALSAIDDNEERSLIADQIASVPEA